MGEELLKSCKELRDAFAATFRVIIAHPAHPELITALLKELKGIGIEDGVGLRAQEAIAKYEAREGGSNGV